MISSAVSALRSAYLFSKEFDSTAKTDDLLLLDAMLRTRKDLDDATRVFIDKCMEGIRAKSADSRVKLPDRPSDK